MAVAQTGAIYKALNFDGQSSRTYGVYITGEAVYNAPEREVEMVTVPGRNGAFALDKGRFENITVTYPAGIYADTEADFADAISDFRNFLCSRSGYCRLIDEYNPDEYRLAIYKSGLEVSPALLRAGEFNITFECQPQRFLLSGEDEITVTSGDEITNPTLFDARPLLEVEGYGLIDLAGHKISLANAVMGNVQILNNETPSIEYYNYENPPLSYIEAKYKTGAIPVQAYSNSGDTFTATVGIKLHEIISFAQSVSSASITTQPSAMNVSLSRSGTALNFSINAELSGAIGTNVSTSDSFVVTATYKHIGPGNPTYTITSTITVTLAYDATNNDIAVTVRTADNSLYWSTADIQENVSFAVESTVSILGTPTYIDCDMGEAYKVESGETISLNRYIDLGSQLPKLKPGNTEITFDNTITGFKIIPNWWKI